MLSAEGSDCDSDCDGDDNEDEDAAATPSEGRARVGARGTSADGIETERTVFEPGGGGGGGGGELADGSDDTADDV